MAILQLKSTNPAFSFLIRKNPKSGMQVRAVRKGLAYGWYSDEATYNVYFRDADNEVSFKQHQQEEFEYLNVSRYNTPLFPLNAFHEFFSAPTKVQHEQDQAGYTHTLFINLIHIELPKYITFFEQHITDVQFKMEYKAHKSYSLTLTSQTSLYELLHTANVLCLFLAMFGNEHLDVTDSILDKYIKSIGIIDAPFYIRSLFVRNFLNGKNRFQKYKAVMEQTKWYNIDFAYGGTALQRRNFIREHLPFNKSILDLGCGEGFYAIPFAEKIEDSYYAIDIDEACIETVARKAENKNIDNIATFSSLDQFLAQYNGELCDVILTEVIEHMTVEQATELIIQLCIHVKFEQLIITTPNADFNTYYGLNEFRHEDHKWEMGQAKFKAWIHELLGQLGFYYEYIEIGDAVNGIYTTQGVIVKGKEE